MKRRRRRKSVEEVLVAGTNVGRRLHHYVSKYGEENVRAAITRIRKSVPFKSRYLERCTACMPGEEALEGMYREYVATCRDPVLTYIEYKALVDIMVELM